MGLRMETQLLWSPSEDRIRQSRMTEFLQFVNDAFAADATDYTTLWQWSIEHRDLFWSAMWEYAGVVSLQSWNEPLIDGDQMPGAKWFSGAKLNFAENLLRFDDDQRAIVAWNEDGRSGELTYRELRVEVARVADWLRSQGIGVGSRVAAYLPNIPETVIAMLAAAAVGATFSSCSPDFGVEGVVDRFGQVEPEILFAVDECRYAGKTHDCRPRIDEITRKIPSIRSTVVIPFSRDPEGSAANSVLWNEIQPTDAPLEFEQLPFDHPLYILFSSGTTGVPKCIVHGAGGTLLQHFKEHQLHTDLRRDDRLFYFTTCGWMMWNWLVSGLATGCTIVLYDGSPFHPQPGHLWDMVDAERITVFGTGAKYISAIEKAGVVPRESHRLDSLRAILSTGSPLMPESFDYVYTQIKSDVCLSSISGGTDIVSCFVLGNPIQPVYRGEIQSAGLGMAVDVFDDEGNSLETGKGELVCTKPFPSMPVGFWNDPDGSKYQAAYFDRFPNVWHHGDFAEKTQHDAITGYIIHGRSDAVLNPGGVRIGTAEIYRQVETFDEVLESLAVGQQWEGDERIILFVRLRDDVEISEELQAAIRTRIRQNASPRHVPAVIAAVPDLPRTKSGKIAEIAVREVIHDRPVKNQHALANPESLEDFQGERWT